MRIDRSGTVGELSKAFQAHFPLLKLKFYKVAHEHFHGSPKKDEVAGNMKLLELNPDLTDGVITIEEEMTVDALETKLEEDYGLHAQVFRKSGGQWLQTSVTDHWPLNKHLKIATQDEAFHNSKED